MVDIDYAVIPQFHWADYLIFSLSLGTCIGIGMISRFCAKSQSSAEQLTGGRGLRALPVAISCMMTGSSPPFFLGNPAEIYTYGPVYALLFFAYFLVVPVVGHGFLPTIYKLNITTAYEVSSFFLSWKFLPSLGYMVPRGISHYITVPGLQCKLTTLIGIRKFTPLRVSQDFLHGIEVNPKL